MDEDSGDDGQTQDAVDEENAIPKIITPDYFMEFCAKSLQTIEKLQINQDFNLADDFQKSLIVAQNVWISFLNEIEKNAEIQNEAENAKNKVVAAFKISQVDQDTIERLKDEIALAWKQTDAAQNREQTTQQQLHDIRSKFEKLQFQIKKVDKKDGQDDLGPNLQKHKDSLLRERDRLNAEVEELNRRLQIQRLYADELERKRKECEDKNKELYKLLDETSNEAFKEKRVLDKLKVDFIEVTNERNNLANEIQHYKNQLDTLQTNNVQLNLKIGVIKTNLEKMTTLQSVSAAKLTKSTNDLIESNRERNKINIQMGQNNTILKIKDSECNRLIKDNNQQIKKREILQNKLMQMEVIKGDLSQELLKIKSTIVTFEKERDANKKSYDQLRKYADDLQRERDLVRKDLQKATRVIGEQVEIIMMHEQHIKTLGNEIKQHLEAAQKQRSILIKVEKERDKNAEDLQVLADKLEQCQDDLQMKLAYIGTLKLDIDEIKANLSNVQQIFEQTRSERNAFQRDLQATVEDRDDVKDRFTISIGQIEQLKENITTKEMEITRANKQIDKLEKDKIAFKIEIQNINVTLQHTRTELKEKKTENDRLYKTLSDDELKLMKLRTQLDTTQNEKDLIGTQLIRRNDEIGLLNEKINIFQMALDRGEAQYNKRLDDIRLLKIEISNLGSKRNLLTRGLVNTADMRQEVLQINRVLTQERVRAKALEQEMMTPMNIHRWRKLSGKDPDKIELLVKVQALQKRILKQTVFAVERENALQESHTLYISLKQFMMKLPTHAIKEKLCTTRRVLTAKTKKLKAITAEIKANQFDLKSKNLDIEEYQKRILDTKQELLKEKKEKEKLKQVLISLTQTGNPNGQNSTNTSGYKTYGAGYRIPNVLDDYE